MSASRHAARPHQFLIHRKEVPGAAQRLGMDLHPARRLHLGKVSPDHRGDDVDHRLLQRENVGFLRAAGDLYRRTVDPDARPAQQRLPEREPQLAGIAFGRRDAVTGAPDAPPHAERSPGAHGQRNRRRHAGPGNASARIDASPLGIRADRDMRAEPVFGNPEGKPLDLAVQPRIDQPAVVLQGE